MGSDHCPTVVTLDDCDYQIEDLGWPTFKFTKADWSRFKSICNESLTSDTVIRPNINSPDDMYNNIADAIINAAEKTYHRLEMDITVLESKRNCRTGMKIVVMQFMHEIVPEIK